MGALSRGFIIGCAFNGAAAALCVWLAWAWALEWAYPEPVHCRVLIGGTCYREYDIFPESRIVTVTVSNGPAYVNQFGVWSVGITHVQLYATNQISLRATAL